MPSTIRFIHICPTYFIHSHFLSTDFFAAALLCDIFLRTEIMKDWSYRSERGCGGETQTENWMQAAPSCSISDFVFCHCVVLIGAAVSSSQQPDPPSLTPKQQTHTHWWLWQTRSDSSTVQWQRFIHRNKKMNSGAQRAQRNGSPTRLLSTSTQKESLLVILCLRWLF